MEQAINQMNVYCEPDRVDFNQGRLLLTLHDAAIRFIGLAEKQIESGNLEAKELSLGKAYAIITEFMNSLDHRTAPELCSNLERVYEFMLEQLVTANANMDPQPLRPVVAQLTSLRDAWAEVVC